MNSKKGFGQDYVNQMLYQITQFRYLANRNRSKSNPNRRYSVNSETYIKSNNSLNMLSQKKIIPRQATSKMDKKTQRQSLMLKKLRCYQQKSINQLKSPFEKIHLRRPHSAEIGNRQHEQFGNGKEKGQSAKCKENERYQQIKQYYETKYVKSNENNKVEQLLAKNNSFGTQQEFQYQYELGKIVNENRPVSSRRSYYIGKKKNT